ncbi:hypothetical protein DYB37_006566 [Aphanomyces astaci]|uniref:phospholipase D n=1 Tax=Aphanomyces astaci TaxID=112090 RepID=A0A3R6XNC3_APHAT|nr:hypothetical protein DYB37_006566 [Aphanomyces astaci]
MMAAWWLFGGNKYGQDADNTLEIFEHAPTVKVKSVRIDDDWPVKTVEFEVKLRYKDISREIYLPKSNVYRLWFYIKGHGYLRTPPPSAASRSSPPPQTSTTSNNVPVDDVEMPQLRDFLFATSQASTTPEMISLLETYLNAALSIPVVRSSAYVLSLLQISGGTFDNDAGGVVTSQREGWLKVRMWLKGSQDNVRLHRGTVMCDNGCFNCFCVVKKYSWHTSQWRWVALKDSCVAIYESNRDLTPTDVLLFDAGFKLETGLRAVGSAKEFVVTTSAFVLHCQARHKNECIKWANQIRTAAEAMFAAINAAKTEIFIAGWWICPTTSLLRPATDASRLDLVLQRRAQAGVKEISMALTLDSQYAKKTLRKLHHNIHVLRDPDFIMKQLGLWSHHEKIVCIDQRMAFVGGLDLCFGRWDNARHDLFEPKARKDYSNPRIKDFVDVHRPDIDLMDRNLNPRMPWHDCHCKLFGEPAKDVARHFIQRWNYSVSTRFKMHRFHHLVPATGCKPTALSSNLPPHARNSINNNTGNALCVLGFSESTSATTMPPALVSSTDTGTVEGVALTNRSDAGTTDLLDDELQTSALDENRASDDVAEGFACNCQIVRSLSMWSGGCRTEKSIQNAYIRLINDARDFVMQGDPLCQNLIANALVSRILRAHAANQPFRVMVVLPLLPAHSFRMRLFEEHFGLESGGIGLSYREDPTAAPTWMALRQHAMANTNIYEAVFGCLPADSIRSFQDMGVDFVADSVQHPSGRFSQMQHRTSSQEAHDPVSTSDPPGSSSRPPLAPQDNHGDDGRVGVVAAAAVVAGGGGNDEVKSHESGAGKRAGNGRSMSKREQEAHSNAVFTNAMRAFRREQTVTKDLRLQLEDVRGHIVYFPLRFLEHEDLEPKLVPTELLQ